MALFRKRRVGGYIGYYGLSDWWLSTFSREEREYMASQYLGIGIDGSCLEEGDFSQRRSSKEITSAEFLGDLACNLLKPGGHEVLWKILQKAETEPKPKNILALHFFYYSMIKGYYRIRDVKPGALEKAIEACEQQIALAPKASQAFRNEYPQDEHLPRHPGYRQLAIIRRKQGDKAEGDRIDKEATEAGWN
jgi:hypothetical protein